MTYEKKAETLDKLNFLRKREMYYTYGWQLIGTDFICFIGKKGFKCLWYELDSSLKKIVLLEDIIEKVSPEIQNNLIFNMDLLR